MDLVKCVQMPLHYTKSARGTYQLSFAIDPQERRAMRHAPRSKRWRWGPGFFSRWAALAASFVVNAFNLYSYAFGLFSGTLKDNLGFSQSKVDIIASVGELGLWSTFFVDNYLQFQRLTRREVVICLTGLLLERGSPRQIYLLGSVASAIGLGYVALAIGQTVPATPASVAAMFFLANFGTACYAQTAAATAVRNFPAADRGKVSGLIKSVFGLSSAVLGVSYAGLFGGEHVERFLLLLSVGVPVLGVVSSFPLNVVPAKHLSYAIERAQGVSPTMAPFYCWFTVMILFLMAAVAAAFVPFKPPVPWTGISVVLLVLSVCVLPLAYGRVYVRDAMLAFSREASTNGLVHDGDMREWSENSGAGVDDLQLEEDMFGAEAFPLLGSRNGYSSSMQSTSKTWRECLVDVRFWVLFVSFLCGAGSGLVVINNIASLADSLEMSSSSLLVTALGIANALGRLGAGWLSDRIVSAGLPRSLLFCAMLLVTSGVDFLLAAGIKSLLYPLCVAAGVCYGSMFSLVLALTGDLFGPEHIGTNYGLLDLGPAVGSFVFATGVTSVFYNKGGSSVDCIGTKCFEGTFLITAVSCLIATSLAYLTLVRPIFKRESHRAHL